MSDATQVPVQVPPIEVGQQGWPVSPHLTQVESKEQLSEQIAIPWTPPLRVQGRTWSGTQVAPDFKLAVHHLPVVFATASHAVQTKQDGDDTEKFYSLRSLRTCCCSGSCARDQLRGSPLYRPRPRQCHCRHCRHRCHRQGQSSRHHSRGRAPSEASTRARKSKPSVDPMSSHAFR